MIKFFKALFLICVLAINCSACVVEDYDTGYRDGYDYGWTDGIDFGQREVFENLWGAANINSFLQNGERWETDHFSLVLTHGVRKTTIKSSSNETEPYVEFELTLKGETITNCYNNKKILFNIYSHNDYNWTPVLYDDIYYDYALLNQFPLNENSCSASVGLYDDTKRLGIIIVIDGSIYKATYELL